MHWEILQSPNQSLKLSVTYSILRTDKSHQNNKMCWLRELYEIHKMGDFLELCGRQFE